MILLDTHVVYWLNSAPRKLSRSAARAISRESRKEGIAISSISLWELAMHFARGRLRVTQGTALAYLQALLQTPGLSVLDIGPEVALQAAAFPDDFPADPADRLIAATARTRGLQLVTRDSKLQDSPLLRTIW